MSGITAMTPQSHENMNNNRSYDEQKAGNENIYIGKRKQIKNSKLHIWTTEA